MSARSAVEKVSSLVIPWTGSRNNFVVNHPPPLPPALQNVPVQTNVLDDQARTQPAARKKACAAPSHPPSSSSSANAAIEKILDDVVYPILTRLFEDCEKVKRQQVLDEAVVAGCSIVDYGFVEQHLLDVNKIFVDDDENISLM